jgi:hypothetical protein
MFARVEHLHTEYKSSFIYVYRNLIEEALEIQSDFFHLAVLSTMRNTIPRVH